MSTFIIGSRINPIFPDVKPSSIIGINGAIELIEKKYSDFNNVTMVCSPHIFLNDFNKLKNLYKDHRQKAFLFGTAAQSYFQNQTSHHTL